MIQKKGGDQFSFIYTNGMFGKKKREEGKREEIVAFYCLFNLSPISLLFLLYQTYP